MSDIFIKTTGSGSTGWRKMSNLFVKTTGSGSTGWKAAIGVWLRLATSWIKVWPLSGVFATRTAWIGPDSTTAYADRLTSSNVIRIGSNYYGNNAQWDANGWTISSYSYAWKYYPANGGEQTGTTFTGESGTGSGWTAGGTGQDILPVATWSNATNNTTYDRKYVRFEVTANATNSTYSGFSASPYIQIVRRPPINSTRTLSNNSPAVGSQITYSSTWDTTEAYKEESNRTTVVWYKNSVSSTTGGTQVGTGNTYTPISSDADNYLYVIETRYNSGTDYDYGLTTGVSVSVITTNKVQQQLTVDTYPTISSTTGYKTKYASGLYTGTSTDGTIYDTPIFRGNTGAWTPNPSSVNWRFQYSANGSTGWTSFYDFEGIPLSGNDTSENTNHDWYIDNFYTSAGGAGSSTNSVGYYVRFGSEGLQGTTSAGFNYTAGLGPIYAPPTAPGSPTITWNSTFDANNSYITAYWSAATTIGTYYFQYNNGTSWITLGSGTSTTPTSGAQFGPVIAPHGSKSYRVINVNTDSVFAKSANVTFDAAPPPGDVSDIRPFNFSTMTSNLFLTTGIRTTSVQYTFKAQLTAGFNIGPFTQSTSSSTAYLFNNNLSSYFTSKTWNNDTYNPSTTYYKSLKVWYAGNEYTAKLQKFSGVTPPNSTYWTASQVFGSVWNSGTTYSAGQTVWYNGSIWSATTSNSGRTPGTVYNINGVPTTFWNFQQSFPNTYSSSTEYSFGGEIFGTQSTTDYQGTRYAAKDPGFSGQVPVDLNNNINSTYWTKSQTITYYPGDYVLYGGGYYFARSTFDGYYPNNTAYWEPNAMEFRVHVTPYNGSKLGNEAISSLVYFRPDAANNTPPTITTGPTFSSVTSSSFTTTYQPSFYSTRVVIDIKKGSPLQSITNYPKTVTPTVLQDNTDSPSGLSSDTTHSVYITPRYRYTDTVYYDGAQVTGTVKTLINLVAPTITGITYTAPRTINVTVSGGGTYYQLYWNTSGTAPLNTSTLYDAAGTSTTISESLIPSDETTYYFWARSSSENLGNTTVSGNATAGTFSNWSSVSSIKPFARPTSLSGSSSDNTKIALTWSGGAGPEYQVYWTTGSTIRPTDKSSTFDFSAGSTSPYDWTGMSRGTQYYFFIRSTFVDGTTSYYTNWYPAAAPGAGGKAPFYKPGTPTSFTGSASSSTQIDLSWTAPTTSSTQDAASGYDIYYSTSTTAPTSSSTPTTTSTTTSKAITGLTANTQYYFWVRSTNADNTGSNASAWSSRLDVKTTEALSPPSGGVVGTPTLSTSSGTGIDGRIGSIYSVNITTEATGNPAPTKSYQWQYYSNLTDAWVSINGATSSTYTVAFQENTSIDMPGRDVRCQVTWSNSQGSQKSPADTDTTTGKFNVSLPTITNVYAYYYSTASRTPTKANGYPQKPPGTGGTSWVVWYVEGYNMRGINTRTRIGTTSTNLVTQTSTNASDSLNIYPASATMGDGTFYGGGIYRQTGVGGGGQYYALRIQPSSRAGGTGSIGQAIVTNTVQNTTTNQNNSPVTNTWTNITSTQFSGA